MGVLSMLERPSPWLAAVLVAVLATNMGFAEGMSPNEEQSVITNLGVDDGIDVGEGSTADVMAPSSGKVAKKAKVVKLVKVLKAKKRQYLSAVARLLKNPIVSGSQEKEFKKARKKVNAEKNNILRVLARVEEMSILSDKVNEAQAKRAVGYSNAASNYQQLAGGAMERAVKASQGCNDEHVGICLAVKEQGHCGTKAYANDCKVSCNLCPAQFRFKMHSAREKKRKRDVREAGRDAAKKEKEMLDAKIKREKEKANKTRMKLVKNKNKVKTAKNDLRLAKEKAHKAKGGRESKVKSAKGKVLLSKEKRSKAKEKLKKDSIKIKGRKISKAKVKAAKEKEKKAAERAKKKKKKNDAAKKKKQAAEKKLKGLRKKKAKAKAAREKIQKDKAALAKKKEKAKAQAEKDKKAHLKANRDSIAAKKKAKEKKDKAEEKLDALIAKQKQRLKDMANIKLKAKKTRAAAELSSKND